MWSSAQRTGSDKFWTQKDSNTKLSPRLLMSFSCAVTPALTVTPAPGPVPYCVTSTTAKLTSKACTHIASWSLLSLGTVTATVARA